MKVLTLNCGSSSLKFAVWDALTVPGRGITKVADGDIDGIGKSARLTLRLPGGERQSREASLTGYEDAVNAAFELLAQEGLADVEAAGHRVVHGGARFRQPTLIDQEVLTAIEALTELAPLHNG